jgi:hypothetical protein
MICGALLGTVPTAMTAIAGKLAVVSALIQKLSHLFREIILA